ncbi:MAG: response regulator transcription factor [Bacillota bacterium]|nr:response regulator transcription factor [Bacillota bacterium]
MNRYTILIADDDSSIREVLSVLLENEGYNVLQAENGQRAVEETAGRSDIDLVILDIMMPGMSGIEVCGKIRETSSVPVLFLTAKSREQDKVEAYTEGGDDYLVKPFSRTELLMKVKSLLRRYKEYQSGAQVKDGIGTEDEAPVTIDKEKREVFCGQKKIPLTDKEYEILKFFMDHRGETVDNKALYEGVWGEKYLPSGGNTVMVHILKLRRKLEKEAGIFNLIKTVWGKGYKVD